MGVKDSQVKLFGLEDTKSALLVIDMQNDFVRKGGVIYTKDAIGTIPNIKKLLGVFHEKSLPVIYTRAIGITSVPELMTLKHLYYRKLHPDWIRLRACAKGNMRYYEDVRRELDCFDIVEEIYPEGSDIVVDKLFFNAFQGTALEMILRGFSVQNLIITGTATHVCVDATAKAAFDRQFRTVMVSDAVSSNFPDLHSAVLKGFGMLWGRVMTSDEIIEELNS